MKAQHVSSGTPLIIRSSKLYLHPLVYITMWWPAVAKAERENKIWNNKFYYKAASCWYFYWIIHDERIHEYQICKEHYWWKLLLRIPPKRNSKFCICTRLCINFRGAIPVLNWPLGRWAPTVGLRCHSAWETRCIPLGLQLYPLRDLNCT